MKKVWQRNSALLKLTGLIGILLFAFWVGMEPHWDHKYPLHVDEWFAMGYADAMVEEGSTTYANPYRGYHDTISNHNEMGFHSILGFSNNITGLEWMELYRIAPGIMLAMLAFLIYALGRGEGYGWAAALLVPLVPTSVRTLGPAFVVPVTAAMLIIPVVLLLLERFNHCSRNEFLWLLLVMMGGTVLIYPPTLGIVAVIVPLYFLGTIIEDIMHRNYNRARKLIMGAGIVFVAPAVALAIWKPSSFKDLLRESAGVNPIVSGGRMTEYLGFNQGFLEAFGVIGVALFVVGVFVFSWRRRGSVKAYVLPIYTILLLVFLLIVYRNWELGPSVFYERSWSFLGVLMVIFAGYAIGSLLIYAKMLKELKMKYISPRIAQIASIAFVMISIGILITSLYTGLFNNKRDDYAGYYSMVGEKIYTDFIWMNKNMQGENAGIVMEPSLAWTYPAIGGLGNTIVGADAEPFRTDWPFEVTDMLLTGEVNVKWLTQQYVTMIYTRVPAKQSIQDLNSKDLIEVRPAVYVLTSH